MKTKTPENALNSYGYENYPGNNPGNSGIVPQKVQIGSQMPGIRFAWSLVLIVEIFVFSIPSLPFCYRGMAKLTGLLATYSLQTSFTAFS